ncbi:MAG: GntR family transcriptional regulator [Planctomycetaceae bacterium]
MTVPQLQTSIHRISLADSVYETLVEAIVEGQLPPGTSLSSVDLSQQLQVSRTPVTELLQRLAHDGLVEQLSNRKAQVMQLSFEDISEIYEMRMMLEGAAAERAATRLSPETIRSLIQEANRLKSRRREVGWHEQAIEYDLRFHQILAEAADNKRMAEDILRYRRLVRCFCRMTGSEQNLLAALKEHLNILRMLEQRKPAAARKAMVQHIKQRFQTVRSQLNSD